MTCLIQVMKKSIDNVMYVKHNLKTSTNFKTSTNQCELEFCIMAQHYIIILYNFFKSQERKTHILKCNVKIVLPNIPCEYMHFYPFLFTPKAQIYECRLFFYVEFNSQ